MQGHLDHAFSSLGLVFLGSVLQRHLKPVHIGCKETTEQLLLREDNNQSFYLEVETDISDVLH